LDAGSRLIKPERIQLPDQSQEINVIRLAWEDLAA